jgi:hypothetical protein
MVTTLFERVARLEAVEEIRALKMKYARWCDAGFPAEELPAIFTDDCVWDGGEVFGRHAGMDALEAFFAGARSSVSWALHYIVSGAVEVADDHRTATSTWYLWQPMTLDGCAVWHMGRYLDHHEVTDAGWRISSVELTVEALTHVDRGWVAERYLARPQPA